MQAALTQVIIYVSTDDAVSRISTVIPALLNFNQF